MTLDKQAEMLEAIYWMVVQHYADDQCSVYSELSGEDAISILEEYGLIVRHNEYSAHLVDYDTNDKNFFHDKILEKTNENN